MMIITTLPSSYQSLPVTKLALGKSMVLQIWVKPFEPLNSFGDDLELDLD